MIFRGVCYYIMSIFISSNYIEQNLLIDTESLSFLKRYDIYEAVKMSQVLILHKFLLACLYLENVIETCAIISIRSTGYTKSYPTIWSPCTYL